jgi:hypothetical protein
LKHIDSEKGFDIIWVDGSESELGRQLPNKVKLRKCRLKEIFLNVRGGPNAAQKYGLSKLIDLGYEYCGLIDNDILLEPTWFTRILKTFRYAARDNLIVGATTIRNYVSRVLEFRAGYTINWNIGLSMILLRREAAEIILDNYPHEAATTAGILFEYFGKTLGIDLRSMPEWRRLPFPPSLRIEPPDWNFQFLLYNSGMASIGSIPSFASDLDFQIAYRGTRYVAEEDNNKGLNYPTISKQSLFRLRLGKPVSVALLNFLRMRSQQKISNFVFWQSEKIGRPSRR